MPSPNVTNFQGVSVTASTTLNAGAHSGVTVVVNAAAGLTVTLPAATGSNAKYRIVIGTTVSSGSVVVAAAGTDILAGKAGLIDADFATAADSDKMTLNGTTTGGIIGSVIELEDIASGVWLVEAELVSSGDEATPFSAS